MRRPLALLVVLLSLELTRPADQAGPGSLSIAYSQDPREWSWGERHEGPLGVGAGESRQLPNASFEAFEDCRKGAACTQEITVTFRHEGGGPIDVKWSADASITLDDEGDSLSDSAEIVVTITAAGGS